MKCFIKVNTTIENDEVEDMCIEMQGKGSYLLLMLVQIIEALKERGFKDELIKGVVKLGLMQDEVKKAKKKDLDNIFEKIIKDLD